MHIVLKNINMEFFDNGYQLFYFFYSISQFFNSEY